MIRRRVGFQVSGDGGVMPSVPQYGGVKGEHNVTTLSFICQPGVYENGDLVRISFCTGDGTVLSTDILQDVTSDATGHMAVSYPLPQMLTMAGGQLCARLVLSQLDESGKEIETFRSGEAVLYFDESAVENGTPFWTGVSEMLERTVTAKNAAVAAQGQAVAAYRNAFEVRDETKDIRDEAKAHMLKAEQQYLAAHSLAQEVEDHAQEVQSNKEIATTAVSMAGMAAEKAQENAQAAAASDEQAQAAAQAAIQGAYTAASAASTAQNAAQAAANSEAAVKETLTAVYRFKGSVANVMELEAVQDPQVGDVYNVGSSGGTNLGMNYAWTGETWDALGATFTVLDEMTGSPTKEFGKAVSGYAVAQYVQEQTAGCAKIHDEKGAPKEVEQSVWEIESGTIMCDGQNVYIGFPFKVTGGVVPFAELPTGALVRTLISDAVEAATPQFGDGILYDGWNTEKYIIDTEFVNGLIAAQIQAYDTDVMAILGEDEVTA